MISALLLCTLAGCAYVPPLDSGLAPEPTAALSGVAITLDGTAPTGNGHILLYDAADPPPPGGFGAPADLATFSGSAWSSVAGTASAPWSLTGVPEGTWLITALSDEDGDFNPLYDFTAGATCGDRSGAYISDSASMSVQPLAVTPPQSIDGIPVVLGAPIETERPAFSLLDGGQVTQPASLHEYVASPHLITLQSMGIHHELLELADPDAADCPARFHVTLLDADGDGALDPHSDETFAAFGLYDIWPKVYLFYYQDTDGSSLPEGEAWVSEAAVYPLSFLHAGYGPGDSFLADTLPLLFVPGALHIGADGSEEVVYAPDLPSGYWGIAVFQQNGQTWITPNDLALENYEGQTSLIALE